MLAWLAMADETMGPHAPNDETRVADFLFEAGMLARVPRSGFAYLGSGEQSVAEHSLRVAQTAYVLAQMEGDVALERVLAMALFHDLPETRTADQNNVTKRYNTVDEAGALQDQTDGLAFGEEVAELVEEFEAETSPEARLARDADQLEMVLELKRLWDIGNPNAGKWLPYVTQRLRTRSAQELAEAIQDRASDAWWWGEQVRHPRG